MAETPDMNDVAAAALRLIGAFEPGRRHGALPFLRCERAGRA